MLRYIHVGSQILDGGIQFAFWDTVTDRFIEYNGTQVFDDWNDFLLWRAGEEDKYPQHPLDRFLTLME